MRGMAVALLACAWHALPAPAAGADLLARGSRHRGGNRSRASARGVQAPPEPAVPDSDPALPEGLGAVGQDAAAAATFVAGGDAEGAMAKLEAWKVDLEASLKSEPHATAVAEDISARVEKVFAPKAAFLTEGFNMALLALSSPSLEGANSSEVEDVVHSAWQGAEDLVKLVHAETSAMRLLLRSMRRVNTGKVRSLRDWIREVSRAQKGAAAPEAQRLQEAQRNAREVELLMGREADEVEARLERLVEEMKSRAALADTARRDRLCRAEHHVFEAVLRRPWGNPHCAQWPVEKASGALAPPPESGGIVWGAAGRRPSVPLVWTPGARSLLMLLTATAASLATATVVMALHLRCRCAARFEGKGKQLGLAAAVPKAAFPGVAFWPEEEALLPLSQGYWAEVMR